MISLLSLNWRLGYPQEESEVSSHFFHGPEIWWPSNTKHNSQSNVLHPTPRTIIRNPTSDSQSCVIWHQTANILISSGDYDGPSGSASTQQIARSLLCHSTDDKTAQRWRKQLSWASKGNPASSPSTDILTALILLDSWWWIYYYIFKILLLNVNPTVVFCNY